MGNWFSTTSSSQSSKPSLDELPESCVAAVMEYMDPPQICKLASLNRTFRAASFADFVWESKLPSNYEVIHSKIFDDGSFPSHLGKRGIYSRLCSLNTFDDGTKKVWLDRSMGKLCLSISAKGLYITGIDDRRYWNHIPTEESRKTCRDIDEICTSFPFVTLWTKFVLHFLLLFWLMMLQVLRSWFSVCDTWNQDCDAKFSSVAYLQQIWWFEVDGEVEFPFPPGTYSLFFRIHLGKASKRFGRRVCNTEHVHGWDIKPVKFQLWTSNDQHVASHCFLKGTGKWRYYHAGDFVVEDGNVSTKVKFSMTQIDCTHTKGGLCLDSVFVYPSEFRKVKEFLNHS